MDAKFKKAESSEEIEKRCSTCERALDYGMDVIAL
jgi:hypothetical protein